MTKAIDDIVSIQRTTRYYEEGDRTLPGEALTMKDGSTWFHPYTGGRPICVIRPELERQMSRIKESS